jgi:hypothetical protein
MKRRDFIAGLGATGRDPPEPAWKDFDRLKDCVHPRQPTFNG